MKELQNKVNRMRREMLADMDGTEFGDFLKSFEGDEGAALFINYALAATQILIESGSNPTREEFEAIIMNQVPQMMATHIANKS
jgi:hypothetical protein